MTFLPVTSHGYDCILMVVDRLSKLVALIPTTVEVSAADTARLIFDHIICKYGVPTKIRSDHDTRFTSLFWQALFKLLSVKLNLSTAYHP